MKKKTVLVLSAAISAGVGVRSVQAQSALVLNEFNAVDDLLTLENDTAGDGGDTYWGLQTQGNGANWVELVVTQDRVDLRGWKLEWSNADPDAGSFTFTNNPIWSNVRAGTIITVREDDVTPGGTGLLPTNTSFNPGVNDWWIHINVDDPTYLTQAGFKVDNDAWQSTIKDAQGNVKYGPIGENLNPNGWGGSGINSREVGAQTLDPSATTGGSGFQDLDYSTFGAPNYYNDPATGALVRTQDFSSLQSWWTNRLPGDANVDGIVNSNDFTILSGNFGRTGINWFGGDFNNDGRVNGNDFTILSANFGHVAPGVDGEISPADWAALAAAVPEPGAASLLALATTAMIARRRRNG